ncbi:MAG: hypothetical protein DKM50_04880 [Candidatus Margulisiibacteriota bacterium]|nr:MAG: hypothetical protein A2X43_10540 [Candidatus Margulisbacteria bacterium GWD2_39_127]OGI05467.1 MAG: hypothetical protein A2X42_06900 [Candidatus Margulisbacteria bacterium GWF2_38_17]OGI08103.1 MAG: hypothetical protein A2X41_07560 [Candidatus Margulisbacteria bacterium GWE2_39_32]PZM82081.1 MAG: hypothetical protein DKM50_04880 [Candidatus Margulisiibacteriota bacterium]HAR62890.1 hypothetical protein [Candidatus Margulisiibacteriota bacterium]
MAKEITVKSTKNEVMDAYNELLEKVKNQKVIDVKTEKIKEEDKEIIKNATSLSSEKIIKGLAENKLEIAKYFDTLEDRLVNESKKLSDLQHAIEIEKKYLEEIYQIKTNVDSLEALFRAQKEKKETFEAEIEEKKALFDNDLSQKKQQWKKEQDDYENAKKEKESLTKKEREREEEEFNYNLQLKRKKEKDEYEAKKATLEKELIQKKEQVEKQLSDRESFIAGKEQDLVSLKDQVEQFPIRLDQAIKDTEKNTLEKIELKYKHNAELSAKEIEGERKLNKQQIVSLEAKIKEQDEVIKQLRQKTDECGIQVQNIAVKAIEGASAQRVYRSVQEKTGEQ